MLDSLLVYSRMGLEWCGETQRSYTDTKSVEGSAKTVPCVGTEPWTCVRRGNNNLGGKPASKYTEPKASSRGKAASDTHPTLFQSHSQGPTWSCLNPRRSSPRGPPPCPAGTEGYPSPSLALATSFSWKGGAHTAAGDTPINSVLLIQWLFCTWSAWGCSCSWSSFPNHYGISFLWIQRRWGPLLQLCCVTPLCPQSAITRNTES